MRINITLRLVLVFLTASSRIVGWVAHILEQYGDAVLLRPSQKYVGELGKVFVPIGQR